MDIFNGLTMLGGLCLFLFGMSLMGQALEQRAGSGLQTLLAKMTTGRFAGLLTGMGVTAVIQSSSASTVMVVGFVNSGLMTLSQAINVIMGANIGTTVTAWILSLAGIDSSNTFVRLLKPSAFVPVLSLIGIVQYMFCRDEKRKQTGMILLGFATLMFGMETMSSAVSGLRDVPAFTQLFTLFHNPLSGLLAGAALTAVIQSSSASVGILQALSLTGAVSLGTAIPIIMGQNIGTCVTALLSSIGANRNAKRAALVHLCFNTIGALVCLTLFLLLRGSFAAQLSEAAAPVGIAIAHSVFNVFCTLLLLPMSGLLEKMVCRLIPEEDAPEKMVMLDERLLMTPAIALDRCRAVTGEMAGTARDAIRRGIALLNGEEGADGSVIESEEEACDRYEDALGTYLVRLSALSIGAKESGEAATLLHVIGDFERISDHAVSIMRSAQELEGKDQQFSPEARKELTVLEGAVLEILDLTVDSFITSNAEQATAVEPLRQVIDRRKEQMRIRHIIRLQQEKCSIEVGFVWCDLLTDFERIAAHCANIAACTGSAASTHEGVREQWETGDIFCTQFDRLNRKYSLE